MLLPNLKPSHFTSVTPFLSGTSPPCVRRGQVFLNRGVIVVKATFENL